MDRDAALRAIDEAARAGRKVPSRTLWIVAAIVAVIAAIAFVVVLVADGDPSPKQPTASERGYGGFSIGLVVGLVVGIAIGFAMRRQRNSSRSKP
jgi:hypothetical protein